MTNHDVVIIGGGLAGLTAANYVARAGHSVVVHEARGRLGGRATTDERDGFLINQGPHALYRAGAAAQILAELGIETPGGDPGADGRILLDGQLSLAPGGPKTLLTTRALGVREKLELGAALGKLPKLRAGDFAHLRANEWIDGFVTRERNRSLLRAIVRLTTYSGQLDVMSADVAVSQAQLGLGPGVLYLDGGWQHLISTLEATLRSTGKATIELGSKLASVPDAQSVIVAVNSPQAAAAIVGQEIQAGPAATTACLDLGLNAPPEIDFVLGCDQPIYLSNHSASAKLAPTGQYLVSVAAYLDESQQSERFDRAPLDQLAARCGIAPDSIVVDRFLNRMVAASAIPTVELGGMAGRTAVDAFAPTALGKSSRSDHPSGPSVFVAGDWVGADGHLADASMASARLAAQHAVRALTPRSARG